MDSISKIISDIIFDIVFNTIVVIGFIAVISPVLFMVYTISTKEPVPRTEYEVINVNGSSYTLDSQEQNIIKRYIYEIQEEI